jgi:hypothetical protein
MLAGATGVAGAGTAESLGTAGVAGVAGVVAGAVMPGRFFITLLLSRSLPLITNASIKVVMKKVAAAPAVKRDKKFAEPDAPNTLPDAPLPKAAPMSAPLPCCMSTKPITTSAEMICTTWMRVLKIAMVYFTVCS